MNNVFHDTNWYSTSIQSPNINYIYQLKKEKELNSMNITQICTFKYKNEGDTRQTSKIKAET